MQYRTRSINTRKYIQPLLDLIVRYFTSNTGKIDGCRLRRFVEKHSTDISKSALLYFQGIIHQECQKTVHIIAVCDWWRIQHSRWHRQSLDMCR